MAARERAKKAWELLQRKIYTCRACGTNLHHDDAFVHAQYACPHRQKGLIVRG